MSTQDGTPPASAGLSPQNDAPSESRATYLARFMHTRYRVQEYEDMYSGMSGVIFRSGHHMMERGISPEQNRDVLEFGGGGMPHFYWMNSTKMRQYTVSDRVADHGKRLAQLRADMPPHVGLSLHDFVADPSLSGIGKGYSRIIASHVLEHIPDPEATIVKWISLLADDGVLSIAIPCDPGWFWRLGQIVLYRSLREQLAFEEYDLVMSREHINSVQRVLKILRYYSPSFSTTWFPSLVPIVDFNLICVVNVRKSGTRNLPQPLPTPR